MKPLTIFSSLVVSILGIGTIPAGNAIWNDVRWLKGKTFEEAYKDGVWSVRFFKADLTLEQFKDIKQEGKKYDGLDGNEECGVNANETGNTFQYWLFELTQSEFEGFLNTENNRNDSKYLMLFEFKQQRDWFGKSKSHAWFEVSVTNLRHNNDWNNRKNQILKAIKSNGETPAPEVFSVLKDENSRIKHNVNQFYVHDKVLIRPLEIDVEDSKNCKKVKISKEHKITV